MEMFYNRLLQGSEYFFFNIMLLLWQINSLQKPKLKDT
jgi:hypothetical protein